MKEIVSLGLNCEKKMSEMTEIYNWIMQRVWVEISRKSCDTGEKSEAFFTFSKVIQWAGPAWRSTPRIQGLTDQTKCISAENTIRDQCPHTGWT